MTNLFESCRIEVKLREKALKQKHTIYLLHFAHAYKGKRHYIGRTINLKERLTKHLAGKGSRWVAFMLKHPPGNTYQVAITFSCADNQEAYNLERQLKNRHGASSWCPLCKEERR